MAIIDFSFPTLHKNEWIVRIIKTAPKDNLHPQTMRFENKDDAFKYYEQIRQLWQRQQGITR